MIDPISSLAPSVGSVAGVGLAPAVGGVAQTTNAADVTFSQMVDQIAKGSLDALKAGEAAAISGVQGKLSIQQAVDAVMSAERSLQTMIAVRDKAVNAYQEISKMSI
jgi:flagellar hook-basal body complex protein FliE